MNQRRWGAVLSYVNIVASLLVGLVYTPIMLRLLGQSEYGLYSLIGSVVGYLSILDLGLGNTIVRYTAQNRASGTTTREAELNGLFLMVYTIIGIITVMIGAVLYSNIETLFADTLSADELGRARIMMLLLIFNFAITFPLSIFGSIMQAYEKFVYLRIVNILRVLLNPCIVLPLLLLGYGSVMMVAVATALNIACLLLNVWYCFHNLHIQFRYGTYEKSFLLEIAGYSFFIFLNAIMDKLYYSTGQFVLGMVSGTIQVAIYAVAMQFIMMNMQFSCAISGVLLPKVTMMVEQGADNRTLTDMMIRIGRLQYIIVFGIFSLFVAVGQDFIFLWAGAEYSSAYWIVMLIMLSQVTPLIQNLGISILLAKNLNQYRMTIYTIAAFSNLIVSIPMAKVFGGYGVAVTTAVAIFISTGLLMNRYYQKKIGLDMTRFWKNMIQLSKGSLLLLALSVLCKQMNPIEYTWVNFTLEAMLYSLLYVGVLYKWGMNGYEKGLLIGSIGKLRAKLS